MEIYFRFLLAFSFVLAALTVSVMLKVRNQSQEQGRKAKGIYSLRVLLELGCIYCVTTILGLVAVFI